MFKNKCDLLKRCLFTGLVLLLAPCLYTFFVFPLLCFFTYLFLCLFISCEKWESELTFIKYSFCPYCALPFTWIFLFGFQNSHTPGIIINLILQIRSWKGVINTQWIHCKRFESISVCLHSQEQRALYNHIFTIFSTKSISFVKAHMEKPACI